MFDPAEDPNLHTDWHGGSVDSGARVSAGSPACSSDDGLHVMVDELEGVLESLRSAASVSFESCDEQVACNTVLKLEEVRRFLDATECHALAELEARSVTDRAFGLRTSPWLAARAGLPSGVAKTRVKTAKALGRLLPDVDRALTDGSIGFEHARVFAYATNSRNAEGMAAVSQELCAEAQHMMFNKWRGHVEQVADLLDQDGSYDPDADLARNHLSLSSTGDTLGIRGELVGEHAVVTQQVLNQIADELFHQFKKDNEVTPDLQIPERSTLLALAFHEACRRASATPVGSSRPAKVEANIILTPDASCCLGTCSQIDDEADSCGHDCPGVTGHSHHDGLGLFFDHGRQWARTRGFAGMSVYGDNGQLLHQRAWRTLLCDQTMRATIVNSLRVPLDMGREIRFANANQRRALALRDGGCTFPGCSAPASWTDAHHSQHWEHGGRTDIDNLASLCRHHHGVAHRRGWSVTIDDAGWTLWTTPSGYQFHGQQHQQLKRPPP